MFNKNIERFAMLVKKIRIFFTLLIKPKKSYFLFNTKKRSLKPISKCYGFDRGTPIDRYYINKFLDEHKEYIKGHCLEITDNAYTIKFGENRVTKSDVLDIDEKNKKANIKGDLRDLNNIVDDKYDCIIATHVFGIIDEYQKSIKECYRILKPGGVLIATVSAMGVAAQVEFSYWRFTQTSMRYVFDRIFPSKKNKIISYGNVLSGQAFWVGMGTEELTEAELEFSDPRYAIIVGIVARK